MYLSITEQYPQLVLSPRLEVAECSSEHSWGCPKDFSMATLKSSHAQVFTSGIAFAVALLALLYASNESEEHSMSITLKDYFFKIMASPLPSTLMSTSMSSGYHHDRPQQPSDHSFMQMPL